MGKVPHYLRRSRPARSSRTPRQGRGWRRCGTAPGKPHLWLGLCTVCGNTSATARSEVSTKVGLMTRAAGKTYQDVPLQEQARFNGDADTGVAVSLHVAERIRVRKCKCRLMSSTLIENAESRYNNRFHTRSPMCRPAALLGRSSGKVGSLCNKDSLFTGPARITLSDASGSSSPPLDSKLGIPCMITWWRKRGLLLILMCPDRRPLKYRTYLRMN